MKYLLHCLLVLCVVFSANAQDTLPVIDSQNLVVVDSPAPAPLYDTLELAAFELQTRPDTLLIVVESHKDKKAFISTLKINGEEQILLFENGVAALAHPFTYKGELVKVQSEHGEGKLKQAFTQIVHVRKTDNSSVRSQHIPLWMSIIPPLVAILLALITRQVLLALFMGILAGAWLTNGMPLHPYELMRAVFKVLDFYILQSLYSTSHLSVIAFSMMIGGMVAVISRNGGMVGIVMKLSPLAKSPVSTQFVAWLLGVAIFFDDYANSLIVGNTMRPLTDKYRISREKLSYIVDSTAAPVASIAFITTWIGAELGYISDAMPGLAGLENPPSAYSVFLSSLPYAFYSYFTLIFMLLVIFTKRDFGAMYKAEYRARTTGKVFDVSSNDASEEDLEELEPVKGAPLRWVNGLVPVLVVVLGTLMGLIDTGMSSSFGQLEEKGIALSSNGWGETWGKIHLLNASEREIWQAIDKQPAADVWKVVSPLASPNIPNPTTEEELKAAIHGLSAHQIWDKYPQVVPIEAVSGMRKTGILIGNADSYSSLLWASLSAVFIAIFMTLVQRIMKMSDAINTTVKGFKTMMPALLILVLAWSLATTTEELSTAEFLTSILSGNISPTLLPVIIFVLSAVISFSTGSSWSTMAILYPISIPLTWSICMEAGMSVDDSMLILYNVIATVLSASVWGDHCSPISDTTILSSLASSCNHVAHVNTQMPYAMLVGITSLVINYLATILGLPFLVNLLIGTAVLVGWLLVFGKRVPDAPTAE